MGPSRWKVDTDEMKSKTLVQSSVAYSDPDPKKFEFFVSHKDLHVVIVINSFRRTIRHWPY